MSDHKVIGYFAYEPGGKVVCDGDSCVIAGSDEKMKSYIAEFGKSTKTVTVKKTRFGEMPEGTFLPVFIPGRASGRKMSSHHAV